MRITITLSEAEVKGIRRYLLEDQDRVTKKDIQRQVEGELHSVFQMQHSNLADYIREAENS